ncbi:MAG: hypothetical protein EA001_13685 [Oscillatoriales cyanobacterium]|nr:MAG: hypothetical protein EA001_13685 [Oscillatoriales cyanobacterium]
MTTNNSGRSPTENTITLRTSTKHRLLARGIVLLLLTGLGSYAFLQESQRQYQRGQTLTPAAYNDRYEAYRASLLSKKIMLDYPPLTVVATGLVVLGIVGSYELLVLGISLLIGRFWRT